MKFEKVVLSLSVMAFLIAASHSSLAANTNTAGKNYVTKSKSKAVAKSKKRKKSRHKISVDDEIAQEVRNYEMAAVKNPAKSESVMMDIKRTSKRSAKTTAKISTVKPEENIFSGSVNFTAGKDSNIDPDKTSIKGTYFQIDPTLSFKSGNWSGSFGASIKDFAEQDQSDLFKQSEATASTSYTTKISNITTSTTTVKGLYHDEKWPDYINATSGVTPGYDLDGNTQSMAIRYGELSIEQKLGFDFGKVNTEIGGSAKRRDSFSLFSDFAPDIFGAKPYEKDYTDLIAFAKITVAAADFLDLSLRPQIKQTKYDEREGRLTNGTPPGFEITNPLYELISSEVAFDIGFKFGKSNITPTAVIGQQSDEAMGAEDNTFYGFGLNSKLVLHEATQLTLTPNIMYKKISYSNWTAGTPSYDEKRVDDETTTGVTASIQVAKNFALGAAYNMTLEKSNKFEDTSENYRQEIVSSTLTFNF
ncbi:MAG: hypothetical protein KDD38_06730 [Bdellovibrionales bacterium]|nr:hypothetical protein [Bdellovibrionales bacterium]